MLNQAKKYNLSLGDAHGWKESMYSSIYMFELTASDFDGRNNGFNIPRMHMATQTITLSGYFSFPAKQTLSGH